MVLEIILISGIITFFVYSVYINIRKNKDTSKYTQYTQYIHKLNMCHIRLLFLSLSTDDDIIKYTYNKLLSICKDEKIPVKYDTNECNKRHAAGLYCYSKDLTCFEIVLRQESESENLNTFLHEIGHHFGIHYHNDKSEEFANMYTKDIIEKYFPTYFREIFKTLIKIRTNSDYRIDSDVMSEYEVLKNDPELCHIIAKYPQYSIKT